MINYITAPFKWFFKLEAASGLILLIAAIVALILSNTNLSDYDLIYWGGQESEGSALFNDLATKMNDIDAFVESGGVVFVATGTWGGSMPVPGPIVTVYTSDYVQYPQEGCPAEGLPSEVFGCSSYHDYFDNIENLKPKYFVFPNRNNYKKIK